MSVNNRRESIAVKVGNVTIGGNAPIVVQSMVSSPTNNIESCVEESIKIIEAGGEMVRFTAASVAEAISIGKIKEELIKRGYSTPLIADVHFNPKAAFTAAALIDKVRINPGNFIDPRAIFENVKYSDDEYRGELERLDDEFCKLLDICIEHDTALRIGVNHGSLSDRIMSRYGDTVAGMCESALEFLRVCKRREFHNVVVSMKSSNVVVMVEAYRAISAAMNREEMSYPLHLGVTEAGEGEDARVKSALGIGTLLGEGIGDTIRVSLTEPSWHEIEVAQKIIDYAQKAMGDMVENYDILRLEAPKVVSDLFSSNSDIMADMNKLPEDEKILVFDCNGDDYGVELSKFIASSDPQSKLALKKSYNESDSLLFTIKLAIDLGRTLLSGRGDYIMVENLCRQIDSEQQLSIIFSLLQASRARITRTEFISCPSCGRTQFAIASTVKMVKERCSHFKGVKIAIMGCNVNGPGEMADAHFGYIGAGKGKVNLYRGREMVKKGVDEAIAVDELVKLIERG